jgi:hypothetical protein
MNRLEKIKSIRQSLADNNCSVGSLNADFPGFCGGSAFW